MITLKTRDEIIEDLQAYQSALTPELSLSKDTDAGARIEMLADAVLGLHSDLYQAELNMFPQYCDDDSLIKHAEAHLGPNPRKAATKSSMEMGLEVSGTYATTFESGLTLIHENGTRYITTTGGTISVYGTWYVDIESIDAGTICNLAVGEILTFESPPSGIESEAVIDVALTGGVDEETIDDLRVRVLDAIQNPPAGGRFSDYRQWAMEIAGVNRAYVYGPSSSYPAGRRGLGYVDVAILGPGTGAARVPSADVQTEVEDYIESVRPCCTRGVQVLLPTSVPRNVSITVTPETNYEFDWTTASAWTVSTYDTTTKKLTWNATLPTDLAIGDRILVNNQVATVESLASDYTILKEDDLDIDPSDVIVPAGPLTQPLLDAIMDYFDELGPVRGTAVDPTLSAPDPNQTWDGYIKINKFRRAITNVSGVDDYTLNYPTGDEYTVDHGPSGTVDFFTYGTILIYEAA